MLPGVLLRNGHQQFVCKNIYLKGLGSSRPLKIPVAHGEGRYYADNKILDDLEANGQVIYRYCDEHGNITPEANPNATSRNIAGICNTHRNVFGMMPHPERATSEALGNTDGRIILNALLINQAVVQVKADPALVI